MRRAYSKPRRPEAWPIRPEARPIPNRGGQKLLKAAAAVSYSATVLISTKLYLTV